MAGEPILIVDDTLVNLKLTRILLANQGYRVLTASSAEEAVEVLRTNRPLLVLTDIQLPGMDGLELTRRIKSGVDTRDIVVVALAAFASQSEQEDALQAGCDGCISKPVDTLALGSRVREFLNRQKVTRPAVQAEKPASLSDSDLRPLRGRFLEEAYAQARQWEVELEGDFDPEPAAQVAHQWVGAAGLLGYPEISEKARGLEVVLRSRPIDTSELREALDGLLPAFAARQAGNKQEPEVRSQKSQ
jgi:two-component system, cell cycle response regulator DivK